MHGEHRRIGRDLVAALQQGRWDHAEERMDDLRPWACRDLQQQIAEAERMLADDAENDAAAAGAVEPEGGKHPDLMTALEESLAHLKAEG